MITRTISRCMRTFIPISTRTKISPIYLRHEPRVLPSIIQPHSRRTFAARTSADEQLEELQELSAALPDSAIAELLTMLLQLRNSKRRVRNSL